MKRRPTPHPSGQMMLIGILLILILMISIPAIVFINNSSARAGVKSQANQKAMAAAQEGVSYAMHVLSASPANWQSALANIPISGLSGSVNSGTSGGVYSIEVNSAN